MILLPQHLADRLKANGEASAREEHDHIPVVKFFDPCSAGTWLITEIDPNDEDLLFGLCDLGMGFPEIGHVLLSELKSVEGHLGIGLERDLHFQTKHSLSVYAHAAQIFSRITEDADLLARSAVALGLDAATQLPIPGKTPRQ